MRVFLFHEWCASLRFLPLMLNLLFLHELDQIVDCHQSCWIPFFPSNIPWLKFVRHKMKESFLYKFKGRQPPFCWHIIDIWISLSVDFEFHPTHIFFRLDSIKLILSEDYMFIEFWSRIVSPIQKHHNSWLVLIRSWFIFCDLLLPSVGFYSRREGYNSYLMLRCFFCSGSTFFWRSFRRLVCSWFLLCTGSAILVVGMFLCLGGCLYQRRCHKRSTSTIVIIIIVIIIIITFTVFFWSFLKVRQSFKLILSHHLINLLLPWRTNWGWCGLCSLYG